MKLSAIDQQFSEILNNLQNIYLLNDAAPEKLVYTIELLTARINAEMTYPKIAFIGQYSGGKSTIISALTSNSFIKIGEGVTTDKTQSYTWGNVVLVDTPGILAGEKEEHDEITMNEIDQSDLLVYVTTMNGFDHFIAENFKKIIIDQNRYERCLLVINKADSESEDAKNEILKHVSEVVNNDFILERLNILFIDAKCYLEALAEEDLDDKNELLEISNFEQFQHELHRFSIEKRLIAKYLAPLNLLEDEVVNYIVEATTLSEEANTLKREAMKKKDQLSEKRQSLVSLADKEIKNYLNSLATSYDDIVDNIELTDLEKSYNLLNERMNKDVDAFCDQLNEQLQAKIEQLYETFAKEELLNWAERYLSTEDFLEFKKNYKGQSLQDILKDSPKIVKQFGEFIEMSAKMFTSKTQNKDAIEKGLKGIRAAKDSTLYKLLNERAKSKGQKIHWATLAKKVSELGESGEKIAKFGEKLGKADKFLVPFSVSLEFISEHREERNLTKEKSALNNNLKTKQDNLRKDLTNHFRKVIDKNIQPLSDEINKELILITESSCTKDHVVTELKNILNAIQYTIKGCF